MEDVEHLPRLRRIEIEPVAPQKLQCVPAPWIVTRRDGDTAVGLEPLDGQLHARCRTDAEVHHFATGREQTRQYRRADHWSRSARVAADQDARAIEVGAERLGKLDGQLGREGLAYNSAYTGD